MTYQNDPDRGSGSRGFGRREDGSWNVLPLVFGALALGLAGVLLFGDNFGGPNRPSLTDTTPNTPVAK